MSPEKEPPLPRHSHLAFGQGGVWVAPSLWSLQIKWTLPNITHRDGGRDVFLT